MPRLRWESTEELSTRSEEDREEPGLLLGRLQFVELYDEVDARGLSVTCCELWPDGRLLLSCALLLVDFFTRPLAML